MLAVSTAAPLIRWAHADPAFLAAGRLTLAALVLVPLALSRPGRNFSEWRASHYLKTLFSGLLLAVHFLLWITSLGMTSVASSVFLVTLHPVLTAVLGHFVNRDRPGRHLWLALACSAAAAVAIVGPDLARGLAAGEGVVRIQGDGLAFGGGLAVSVYFLLGRSVRRESSTVAYAGLSYAVAALATWGLIALRGTPVLGLPARAYIAVLCMGLGPQLIGHTTFNWALRRLAAGPVAVVSSLEPVGASLLAWGFLGERPPVALALAVPLAALGILLASAPDDSAASSPPRSKESVAGDR